MTILLWNVRGLNLKERRRDVIDHITKLEPSMVGLVETKVKEHKSYRIPKFSLRVGVSPITMYALPKEESGYAGIRMFGTV